MNKSDRKWEARWKAAGYDEQMKKYYATKDRLEPRSCGIASRSWFETSTNEELFGVSVKITRDNPSPADITFNRKSQTW